MKVPMSKPDPTKTTSQPGFPLTPATVFAKSLALIGRSDPKLEENSTSRGKRRERHESPSHADEFGEVPNRTDHSTNDGKAYGEHSERAP